MRFYKKKFIIAFLCLAASAALTWKLFDVVESTKNTVTLPRVIGRIEKGARITNDMIAYAEVGSYGLDERTIKSGEFIIGRYAAGDMFSGDMFTPDKIKSLEEISDNYVIKARNENKTAVSVQLKSISAGLSGKLKAGDVVSAYVFVNHGGIGSSNGEVVAYPELQYLEIAAVTNNRAEEIKYEPDREIDFDKVKTLGDTAIPASVIFIADEKQAIRLVEAENTGTIHLIFRGRGEYGQELLNGLQ
jgi:pilus assembly protein CpaB